MVGVSEVYRDFEDMVYLILELFCEVVQHHLCYLGEVRCSLYYFHRHALWGLRKSFV